MRVKFHNPDYPEGMEFEVGGILLPNGEDVVLDPETEEYYGNLVGDLKHYLLQNRHMTVDGQGYVEPEQFTAEPQLTFHATTATTSEVETDDNAEEGDN